uniref:hypothetical protein n=1 Tax=Candidatus Fimivicinus sp. TaxID=3056640 RepID=UPI003FF078A8
MKLLILGGIFVLAGAGCLAFPEPWIFYSALGLGFICLGLLLAIIGAFKKEKPRQ